MILIFGGTTEGRAAVKVVEQGGKPFYYSTLGDTQQLELRHGTRLTGALDADAATAFCRREGIRLLIDAAHPFATGVHRTVEQTAAACSLLVIRYERRPVPLDERVIRCADYADAMQRMEAAGVDRLLALTGVRTIPKLRPFWERHDCRFRILDRADSVAEALAAGFPREKLYFYDPEEPETALLQRLRPDALLTKESGDSGGLPAKIEAARQCGIPIYVVERPALPDSFVRVYTEAGLLRRIDELLPDFFPLRSGYTTGTCACAAACAALHTLLTGDTESQTAVTLPGGERVLLPVAEIRTAGAWASATVVKDAGDDPDVTNGCRITARVQLNDCGTVRFLRGEGVGTVTLPGLGLAVGEPAVNPAPRRMIAANFTAMGVAGADVEISVDDGAALAEKTFNPRVGVVGGISIIGTSGIVRPFSNEAFVRSIEQAVEVAAAVGCTELVINSGARSERILRDIRPDLPPQAFVQYGNFIGETLRAAARCGFRRVTMGIMLGKAVKLAEGHLDTHSHKVTLNRSFLQESAVSAGCSAAAAETIGRITLARELWSELTSDERDRLLPAILSASHAHCAPLLPDGRLEMLLISEEGETAYCKRGEACGAGE